MQEELEKEILLKKNDYENAQKQLLTIPGVGQWTASYVSMRCLKNPSAFPIDDIGLHNAIKQQLNLSQKPTVDEIRELSARWTHREA